MKILKILGLLLLLVLAFFLIGGAIQPTHFEYDGTTQIKAPKKIIFETINDLETWEEWGPWKEEDPSIKMTFGDETKGVGASYTWTNKENKGGKMTITEANTYTSQKGKIEFNDGYGGDSFFRLEDGEDHNTTKTTWGYAWDIPYPFNATTLFTGGKTKKEMDSMFTPGLANLKAMCEKAAEGMYRGYRVHNMDYPGAAYLMVRDKIKMSDIGQFYGSNLGKIMGAMSTKGVEIAGFPCGVYYEWDEENKMTDMAAAIPVMNGAKVAAGNIKLVDIPASKGLFIDYYGPYEDTGEAHLAMDDYAKEKGITFSSPVIEAYVTDPSTEPDTARWLTKVYYFYENAVAEGQ